VLRDKEIANFIEAILGVGTRNEI